VSYHEIEAIADGYENHFGLTQKDSKSAQRLIQILKKKNDLGFWEVFLFSKTRKKL
jgi:hypothetical protein